MTEAWKLVNAMAGQEYWQRAEEWLEKHAWAKPKDMKSHCSHDFDNLPLEVEQQEEPRKNPLSASSGSQLAKTLREERRSHQSRPTKIMNTKTDNQATNGSTEDQGPSGSGLGGLTGSRIAVGHYRKGNGAWMDITDVQMPGYPNYDGGATGVSVLWGRNKFFVMARDEDHFWSQFPYSIFEGCFHSANVRDQGHLTAAQGAANKEDEIGG
jgi:hypothetical protein